MNQEINTSLISGGVAGDTKIPNSAMTKIIKQDRTLRDMLRVRSAIFPPVLVLSRRF
ncbi:hypothetical protein BDQ12DRAFT_689707 [Crucibulum laeve]|uniref:Uncharacterized protein n=1 Tax=Crucibulum laeve TaxID=68775 RepID=A0A5C3LMV8_9AGAR|nr:hypothetical protein BDQ12DRAFT_689707 [Crucibulum laeve]